MTPTSRSLLRVGTRASALARWQTARVCEALRAAGWTTTVVAIDTTGDLAPETPIGRLADPALFTRQLDDALLEGRIDLAVHSLKDLPTRLPAGVLLAAVSAREDPRDALVTRDGSGFSALPRGARVATSSLRRRAQLLRARPDLEVVEIRGNVETRVAKLDGTLAMSATLLAVAGLVRLGLGHRIAERLSYDLMLPAPGQAALAVTARELDGPVTSAVRDAVHDTDAALCVGAERALLHALQGGCEVPVAALGELMPNATPPGGTSQAMLRLRGRVVSLDGRQLVEGELLRRVAGPTDAEALGEALAAQLLGDGAGGILDALGDRST